MNGEQITSGQDQTGGADEVDFVLAGGDIGFFIG
ncbi:hypothetical protein LYNGBM3L_49680 [Moorena producens 3L]|uniref:Uncharacterized protein n=1 Tax=Moorena producens 3L TaxID=489825 RepID=F4XY37_9CYAN|nr:hypothetical protein LYNGBM3L_49680 [Moorena producens 3L]